MSRTERRRKGGPTATTRNRSVLIPRWQRSSEKVHVCAQASSIEWAMEQSILCDACTPVPPAETPARWVPHPSPGGIGICIGKSPICPGIIGPIGPMGMPAPIIGKPGAPIGGGPWGMAPAPPIAIAPGNSTTGGVFASATIFGRGLLSSAMNISRTKGSATYFREGGNEVQGKHNTRVTKSAADHTTNVTGDTLNTRINDACRAMRARWASEFYSDTSGVRSTT